MSQPFLFQGSTRRLLWLMAVLQLALLTHGASQIQDGSAFIRGCGWVNIVTNILFGAVTTWNLGRRREQAHGPSHD